jgi:hypothetical protein
MHVVRESIRNLRQHIPLKDDSGQHSAMDALEASISALVEQLSGRESSHHSTGNAPQSILYFIAVWHRGFILFLYRPQS